MAISTNRCFSKANNAQPTSSHENSESISVILITY